MASQHTATMNCLFAAQKQVRERRRKREERRKERERFSYILASIIIVYTQNIIIDCCVLWEESSYLQQAADLTGGIYIKVPEPAALLQFLLVT